MGPLGVTELLVIAVVVISFGIMLFVGALVVIFLLKATGIADIGPAIRRYWKPSDAS
jgi:hypothetical protein